MYRADLYRGSVDLHLTSLNRQRWERSTATTCVCHSCRVMYIWENRLSRPRKAKSVLASTLYRSSEPLKAALKVKWFQQRVSLHISEWISAFELAVEWTVKDSKTVSYSLVAKQWNCTDWQPSTRRWNINRESILSSQIRGSALTVI